MEIEKILSMCDHTLLKPESTFEDIKKICDDAMRFKTASVCIPACYIDEANKYTEGNLTLCTVIGFPNGYSTTNAKCYEAEQAIMDGATEIDMVINIGWLKAGKYNEVEDEIHEVARVCKYYSSRDYHIILKVIVETCLLTEAEIRKMCKICKDAGADYIKTSTGFNTAGATFEAVSIMKDEIDKLGGCLKIKAAGGISSIEDAEKFIELGADRLGTSRIVKLVKESQ